MALWFTNNAWKKRILECEKKLYAPGKVADKYDILEKIRLELDRLYKDDRHKYDELEKALKPNTWQALEDNWTLWNPVPKSHAEWIGPGEMTCRINLLIPIILNVPIKDLQNVLMMNMEAQISIKLHSPVL